MALFGALWCCARALLRCMHDQLEKLFLLAQLLLPLLVFERDFCWGLSCWLLALWLLWQLQLGQQKQQ
jgi:hypothetical protein